MSQQKIRMIDLFAGAGGFTQGFVEVFADTLEVVWANDFNKDAAKTYNANFGAHCVGGNIVDLLNDPSFDVPSADIVIGGPPCQGFSLLNKNRLEDPRKQLWRQFFEVVEKSNAHIFVIENVRQLLNSPEHMQIEDVANALGFKVTSSLLCAADYGVPQIRYRAFIVGSRFSDPDTVFPPKRTHYNPQDQHRLNKALYIESPQPWTTVRDAIEDLPPPKGTEIRDEAGPLDLHFGRNPTQKSLLRYQAIPEEGMNRFDLQERAFHLTPKCWIKKTSGGTDLFGRLWWDRPAFTIRTEFFKPEKGRYLHPVQHRPITHREAARFQTFPDNFVFKGTKIEIARQIGNAVPPILARYVAESVQQLLVKEHVGDG